MILATRVHLVHFDRWCLWAEVGVVDFRGQLVVEALVGLPQVLHGGPEADESPLTYLIQVHGEVAAGEGGLHEGLEHQDLQNDSNNK